jgi:hypothetical protein
VLLPYVTGDEQRQVLASSHEASLAGAPVTYRYHRTSRVDTLINLFVLSLLFAY